MNQGGKEARGGQQGAFLAGGWAGRALLTGVDDERLVLAVWAANASKALFEIPAVQKGLRRAFDHPRQSDAAGPSPTSVSRWKT